MPLAELLRTFFPDRGKCLVAAVTATAIIWSSEVTILA